MTMHRIDDLGFDIVRATEAAALSAGRWMGLGQGSSADTAAATAMLNALNAIDMDGRILVGEDTVIEGKRPLARGQKVGTGNGPAMDVALDPIDGKALLAQGRTGTISVISIAPRGTMWALPAGVTYMEKIVVSPRAASALVEECMDAPAAWTLALVARAEEKAIRDLIVFVLDRPRHQDLIEEIRMAGARVRLRTDGDIAGALMAVSRGVGADLLMGTGGAGEGVCAAGAVKAMGGAMLARLWLQNEAEQAAVETVGMDPAKILTCDDLVASNQIFFAATGVTEGPLLAGVHYRGTHAETNTLVLRGETGTRRLIHAEHRLE